MNQRPGILRRMRDQLCPVWAALAAVVLFGFLATGSAHDHADDAPGSQAIHCPVVAGPIVAGTEAAQTDVGLDRAVFRLEFATPLVAVDSGTPSIHRARGPPAGIRTA